MRNAYAPYTNRPSGAALRLADGRVMTGASFENAAYMEGFSALETAVCRMIADRAPGGARPVIGEMHICFAAPPDYAGNWPDAAGGRIAALFAAPGAQLTLSWPEQDGLSSDIRVALGSPEPSFIWQPPQAQNPPPLFADPVLRGLFNARENALAPVSNYRVGAMAESTCGKIFYGCNVETGGNKSLHAEASALAALVTALGPSARLRRITLLTEGNAAFPCGGCRQHINELALPDTEVVLMNLKGARRSALHCDLLPFSFGNADLESAVE